MAFEGAEFVLPYGIEPERRRFVGDGVNLKRHIVEGMALRWRVSATFMGAAQSLAALVAHRDAQGVSGVFMVELPQRPGVEVPAGTVGMTADRAAGSGTIPVSGAVAAGTLFQIGGGTKLYQAARTLAAAGNLSITPKLVEDHDMDDQLDFSPEMRARYSPDGDFGMRYDDSLLVRVSVEFEEVLP